LAVGLAQEGHGGPQVRDEFRCAEVRLGAGKLEQQLASLLLRQRFLERYSMSKTKIARGTAPAPPTPTTTVPAAPPPGTPPPS